MVHLDLMTDDKLWQFTEEKHEYINMSFDIAGSLVEGNKNQRGHHVWAKVLTSLFHAIMASVNQSVSYYDLKD